MSDSVRYVGDPFVDAGVAVLEYRVQKQVSSFSQTDLVRQAEWLVEEYSRKAWTGYLTVHFPNSGWCNPTIGPEKKRAFLDSVLRGYDRPTILDRTCSYCQRPAQDLADRSKIPLLSGATTMSSGSAGIPGLPVCGFCLLAIQFYPLATLKVKGRPLFWWCLDSAWLVDLTAEFFDDVRTFLAGVPDEMPNLGWPSTRLLTAAEKALTKWVAGNSARSDLPDFMGCHMTNYGSRPNYDEIRIRRSLLDFIAWGAGKKAYASLVARCWEQPRKGKNTSEHDRELFWRNSFYEDLGAALTSPHYSLAVKKVASRYIRQMAPSEAEPGWFELWSEFLRRVAGMNKDRLEAIVGIADQIAKSSEHAKILRRIQRGSRFPDRVDALVYAQRKICEANEPCIETEKLLRALDLAHLDDETGRDIWLVFDLMLIRIYESLPQSERKELLSGLPEVEEQSVVEILEGVKA